ncbi:HTH_Tnp_Tc3_2 domain-containing protein [Trichonephila clavipes]|nr:HTH_Tnp_Tc3_2 domain-containing protein [Trichonephila clavipes]
MTLERSFIIVVHCTGNTYWSGAAVKSNTPLDHCTECRTSMAMHNATVQRPLTMVSPNSNLNTVMLQAEAVFVSKQNAVPFRCPCPPFISPLAVQTQAMETLRTFHFAANGFDWFAGHRMMCDRLNMVCYVSQTRRQACYRMVLMDRAATSRAFSQELGSFARQQVSARTVRRRLQKHGLSAWRSWLRLPLTLHHRPKRLQWCDQ